MRKLLLAGVSCLGLVLTGCPLVSTSTVGLARTLDQGQMQVAFSGATYGALAVGGSTTTNKNLIQLEAALRYGITDHFEVGAKAWLIGAALDGKFSLIRSNGENGFDLSLDPGLAIGRSAGVMTIYLPLLLGLSMGGNQLVIGPKVIDQIVFGGGPASNLLYVGSSLGFAIKINEGLRFLPEVSVAYPIYGNAAATGFGGLLAQLNLSLLYSFGGYSGAGRAPGVPATP